MNHVYRRPRASLRNEVDERLAPAVQDLVSLADGSREIEDLVGQLLVRGHTPEAIRVAFDTLEDAGALEEDFEAWPLSPAESTRYASQVRAFATMARSDPSLEVSAAWLRLGEPLQLAIKRLTVVVTGLGSLGTAVVRDLALAGVGRIVGMETEQHSSTEMGAWSDSSELADRVRYWNPFSEFILASASEPLPSWLAKEQAALHLYCPDRFDTGLQPFLLFCRRCRGVGLGPVRELVTGRER